MRARREVIWSALCIFLVACSAVASGPDTSHDPTIEGVGLLPGSSPDSAVVASDVETTPSTAPTTTTTLPPVPPIGAQVTGNKLLMIGDSITASAAQRYGGELCAALVPLGWQVEVDAEPSRFIDFGSQVLDRRLAAKWDAAYVFLGTNYFGDQRSYARQLEKIVERLAPAPVVLLTVTLFEDSRQEVNDAISLVSSEHTNVHVLDWGSIATADAATILRGDGHHLTNQGRAVLASTVAAVMGQAPVQQPGKCLSTAFSNDSGKSVNGSDTPSKRKVGTTPPITAVKPTSTTVVKQHTSTTLNPGAPPIITSAPTLPPTNPSPTPPPTPTPSPSPTTPSPTTPPPTTPPPTTPPPTPPPVAAPPPPGP